MVDGDYAYILNEKVQEKDFEKRPLDTGIDLRDPEVAALYDDAVRYVSTCNALSLVMLQQYFDIPADRAARLMQALEEQGVVGPYNGGAPRRILIPHREEIPIGVKRRRGDALDQALRELQDAQEAANDPDNPDAPKIHSYSCGCSTFSLILFALLLAYIIIRMLNS